MKRKEMKRKEFKIVSSGRRDSKRPSNAPPIAIGAIGGAFEKNISERARYFNAALEGKI